MSTTLARSLAALLGAATLMGCAATTVHRPDGGAAKPVQPIIADPGAPTPAPSPDRATVRAALALRRSANVARFLAYRDRGSYPLNTYTEGALNVWIDEEGRTCAAATMIRESGYEDLVQATARTNNFIVLGDVQSGPLFDWMLTSGLTQEEVAAIQVPMMGPGGEGAWDRPMIIDETARLRLRYDAVAATLAASADASLDLAVDRVMGRAELVAELAADEATAAVARTELRAALAARRAANLARFVAYRDRGVYPMNTISDGLLNIWIDAQGRTCAAATMIRESGAVELVAETAATNNFVALADVHDGALYDWMLTSGLTQEEVAMIQRPFLGERPGTPAIEQVSHEEIETARLRALYDEVAMAIEASTATSLEVAVDRLMAHPRLAAEVI